MSTSHQQSAPEFPSIETLVAPITDSRHGVGEDLTFDQRLDAIVAARQADDPLLAQGNWVTELKVADWDFVKSQCADLLRHTSKDLKLALWYTDALSHTDHLAGINYGLSLLLALHEEYWLTMYPPLDGEEDSMDIRAGLYSWFVKALTEDLKQLPLSDPSEGGSGLYNYNHYLTARDHDKQRLQNPDSDIKGQLNLNDYYHAIKHSDRAWQQTLIRELGVISSQWDALTNQLNDLMGMDAPVFAPVTDLIAAMILHIKPLLPQHLAEETSDEDAMANDNEDGAGQEHDDSQTSGPSTHFQPMVQSIKPTNFNPQSRDHRVNRQQALKLLGQIQDYFASNEPHSPVTFLLGRAIEWADMPLDQWLAHIIKNEEQLAALADIIGIKPAADPADESY
jgi:type VI secretion system protein ImpA